MTELEKMLAGEIYDCGDPELMALWDKGKNLMREYNLLPYDDRESQLRILDELLGSRGKNTQITQPFYCDYGKFIHLGENCEINMDCVFLDCNHITVGNNVLIAPGVHIYAVGHPLKAKERMTRSAKSDFPFAVGLTKPVIIGDDVWIGGRSVILPGTVIGSGTTIGAGSVVSGTIPNNVLAAGSPCRVIREL